MQSSDGWLCQSWAVIEPRHGLSGNTPLLLGNAGKSPVTFTVLTLLSGVSLIGFPTFFPLGYGEPITKCFSEKNVVYFLTFVIFVFSQGTSNQFKSLHYLKPVIAQVSSTFVTYI